MISVKCDLCRYPQNNFHREGTLNVCHILGRNGHVLVVVTCTYCNRRDVETLLECRLPRQYSAQEGKQKIPIIIIGMIHHLS